MGDMAQGPGLLRLGSSYQVFLLREQLAARLVSLLLVMLVTAEWGFLGAAQGLSWGRQSQGGLPLPLWQPL